MEGRLGTVGRGSGGGDGALPPDTFTMQAFGGGGACMPRPAAAAAVGLEGPLENTTLLPFPESGTGFRQATHLLKSIFELTHFAKLIFDSFPHPFFIFFWKYHTTAFRTS